ncbi:MAG: hypothetical protein JW993_03835 [Sedimentisphaerales bacterium]|nr:hypothetical protein [Sedimentisphaerales bacterium]
MGTFGVFASLAAFIFGCYWCYAIIVRIPEDVRELRETTEVATKIGIAIIWAITVIIALTVLFVGFVFGVVLVHELRAWL